MKEIQLIKRDNFGIELSDEENSSAQPISFNRIAWICKNGEFDTIQLQETFSVGEQLSEAEIIAGAEAGEVILNEEFWLGHWNDGYYVTKEGQKIIGEVS